jgi:hypothetical protein
MVGGTITMNIYMLSWLDDRMEKQTMPVAADTEATAYDIWEDEVADDLCSELTEIVLWEKPQ